MSQDVDTGDRAAPAILSRVQSIGFDKLRQFGLLAALVVLLVVFSFASEYFFTTSNLINVARQMSITAIVAVGMTFVIIAGGIDLSVGSTVALGGVISADVLHRSGSPALAVAAGIVTGIVVGTFNGVVTARGRIAGFITTLATMQAIRGLGYIYTGGNPVSAFDKSFTAIGVDSVLGIPIPILIMLVVVGIGYLLLNRTRFGRYVYAVGGSETASRWTGLRVARVQSLVYVITGMLAGLAGVVLAARLGSGQPAAGQGFELDVIAAVILGGTSLVGGKGKISGTLIGVVLVAVLSNGLTLLDVSTYWQMVIKGAIILAAVILDTRARKS